jgi:conserved oligomeric Golgi complex subunit 3
LFNPAVLLRLVSGGGLLVPKVVRNMLDAKAELDGRLRTVINEFTAAFASRITDPISAKSIAKSGSKFDANAATLTVRKAVEKDVPFLRKKLDEYLDDARTRETLVGSIQDQVAEAYETFYDANVANERAASERGRKGSGMKGKGREDAVWTPEVFEEWVGRIFNVSHIGFEDDGDARSIGGQASDSD